MLVLNPSSVTLGGVEYRDVESVAFERVAAKEVIEWDEGGAHAVFADVVRQRVEIEIGQRLEAGVLDGPRPGEMGLLRVVTGLNAGVQGRRAFTATCVVRSVRVEVSGAGREKARRRLRLVAISADGSTDPVAQTEA